MKSLAGKSPATVRKALMVDWFYVEQEAICYLGATSKCLARHRLMLRRSMPGGYDWATSPDRFAGGACTIEHILPRSARQKGPHLVLMACHDCNKAKGSALPDPAHIERALALGLEYAKIIKPVRQTTPAGLAFYREAIAAGLRAEAELGLALLPKPPAR